MILSKPDRVGLWFYELCCQLPGHLPYLLWLRLWDAVSDPRDAHEAIPCSEIIKQWAEIIRRLNPLAIMAADSYYFDTTGRAYCNDPATRTLYVSSVNAEVRFKELVELVKHSVTASGKWHGVYNDKTK